MKWMPLQQKLNVTYIYYNQKAILQLHTLYIVVEINSNTFKKETEYILKEDKIIIYSE